MELYAEHRISTRSYNALSACGMTVIGDVVDYLNQGKKLMSIKNLGKKSEKELLLFLSENDLLGKEVAISEDEKKYLLSSPTAKEYIGRQFQRLCENRLSVRAKHFMENYQVSPSVLIKLFDKPLGCYRSLCPRKFNSKTLGEIYELNKVFKEIFETCIGWTDTEMKEAEIKTDYPYLSSSQGYFVMDFMSDKGYRPLLFLLYNYLRLSEDRTDRFYSLFHGISDGCPRTTEELSEAFKVSRERVRQIVNGDIPAMHHLGVTEEEMDRYREIFSKPILTKVSEEVSTQMEGERLDCSFNVFASIVHLVTGLEIFSPDKTLRILFNKSSIDKDILNRSFFSLRGVAQGRYPMDTDFNLNDMVTCDDAQRPYLVDMLSYIASVAFEIEVDDDGRFTMRQTYIDMESELCEILSCHDEPMSLDEVFRYFKQKFPNHKYTEPSQLGRYLTKSYRIGSVGRTFTYALKSRWDIIDNYEGFAAESLELPDDTSRKCVEFKRFMNSHHHLPTPKEGKELFEWFRRSLSKYDGYADQKHDSFSDLLDYIASQRFE